MLSLKESDEQQELDQCTNTNRDAANYSGSLELDNDNAPLPLVMRRIPRFFRFDNAPPEATGLALDVYARGTVLMSSLFMGPALLTLATAEAEASCGADQGAACGEDVRIYGMKPSSLLSNIGTKNGVLYLVHAPCCTAYTLSISHMRYGSSALLQLSCRECWLHSFCLSLEPSSITHPTEDRSEFGLQCS